MGIWKWIKNVLDIEDAEDVQVEEAASAPQAPLAAPAPAVSLPMTDEEKELVAVIASCIVGKDKPDAQLHIQKITRIQ